jgi:molybdopterin converting factor small subunit
MAQRAGIAQLELEVPPAATLSRIQPAIRERFPHVPWPDGTLLALNQEYLPLDTPLHDNDEIAIIPPVSGG